MITEPRPMPAETKPPARNTPDQRAQAALDSLVQAARFLAGAELACAIVIAAGADRSIALAARSGPDWFPLQAAVRLAELGDTKLGATEDVSLADLSSLHSREAARGRPQLGSLLALPLMSHDQARGRLLVAHRQPGIFADRQKKVLHRLARDASAILEVLAASSGADQPPPGPALGDATAERSRGRILVVEADPSLAQLSIDLERLGHEVITTGAGDALAMIAETGPEVVVADIAIPGQDGFDLLRRLRSQDRLGETPFIALSSQPEIHDVVSALRAGADDYLARPFQMPELMARIEAKLAPRHQATGSPPPNRLPGVLNQADFKAQLARENRRAQHLERPAVLVRLHIHEADALRRRIGHAGEAQVWEKLTEVVIHQVRPFDLVGQAADGGLSLIFPETDPGAARSLLRQLGQEITGSEFAVGAAVIRITPVIGHTTLTGEPPQELERRADIALGHAAGSLDLEPFAWTPGLERMERSEQARVSLALRWLRGVPGQLGLFAMVAFAVPFLAYMGTYRAGLNIVPFMYFAVVAALLVTSGLIWIEAFNAMRRLDPPPFAGEHPPAAAIIAAYLPNEAATIVDTVRAFLASDYPGPYEVLLAYNTPRDLPVEFTLQLLAEEDKRLRLIRVPGSTSKAQNVNFALGHTMAEMVGIFDADHHPEPGSFKRAWRWLAAGNDVVQGHCLIRNGRENWITRMVAIEFEVMYAVSHPGRARLHRFGIFGGSNGFWRSEALRRTRMHSFMLTEDIDSSMRVVEGGGRIAYDPLLVSRELAPTTLEALWAQRMRWAQGWFEVSLRHLPRALASGHLSPRQKLGMLHLLAWRELFPWLSVQVFPIIAFWTWAQGGPSRLKWLVPIFLLTTLFTTGIGPFQALTAYLLAHPLIRRHRAWFWWYVLASMLFYSHFKNVISIVAQVRHFQGDKQWRVTPRAS